MITRIFVPYDSTEPSNKAFKKALKIAKANKASIAAVMFLKDESFSERLGLVSGYLGKFIEDVTDEFFFNGDIVKLYKECHDAKVPFWQDIVYSASPEKGIVQFAKVNKIDLIVMGRRGRKGWTKKILGSISAKVKKMKLPCKLMIVEK